MGSHGTDLFGRILSKPTNVYGSPFIIQNQSALLDLWPYFSPDIFENLDILLTSPKPRFYAIPDYLTQIFVRMYTTLVKKHIPTLQNIYGNFTERFYQHSKRQPSRKKGF